MKVPSIGYIIIVVDPFTPRTLLEPKHYVDTCYNIGLGVSREVARFRRYFLSIGMSVG